MTNVIIDPEVLHYLNQSFPKIIRSMSLSYENADKTIHSLINELNQELSYANFERKVEIIRTLRKLEEISKDYKKRFHQLLNRVDTVTLNAKSMLTLLTKDLDIYYAFENFNVSPYSKQVTRNVSDGTQQNSSEYQTRNYQIGQTPVVESESIHFTDQNSLEQLQNDPAGFWNMKFTTEEAKQHADGKCFWDDVGKKLKEVNELHDSGKPYTAIWESRMYDDVRKIFFSEASQSFPTVRVKENKLEFAGTNGRHRILIAQKYQQKIPIRIVR